MGSIDAVDPNPGIHQAEYEATGNNRPRRNLLMPATSRRPVNIFDDSSR